MHGAKESTCAWEHLDDEALAPPPSGRPQGETERRLADRLLEGSPGSRLGLLGELRATGPVHVRGGHRLVRRPRGQGVKPTRQHLGARNRLTRRIRTLGVDLSALRSRRSGRHLKVSGGQLTRIGLNPLVVRLELEHVGLGKRVHARANIRRRRPIRRDLARHERLADRARGNRRLIHGRVSSLAALTVVGLMSVLPAVIADEGRARPERRDGAEQRLRPGIMSGHGRLQACQIRGRGCVQRLGHPWRPTVLQKPHKVR